MIYKMILMGDCVVIVDDVNINKPKLYPFSYKVQITNTQFMLSLNDKKNTSQI